MCHGLADIAGGLRPAAQLLRQRAVGGGVAPFNPSRRGIDALEKVRLFAKVELEVGKIRLFTGKIAPRGANRARHVRGRRPRLGVRQAAEQMPVGGFGAFGGQLKARDAGGGPGDAAKAARRLEDEIVLLAGLHCTPSCLGSLLLAKIVPQRADFNPIPARRHGRLADAARRKRQDGSRPGGQRATPTVVVQSSRAWTKSMMRCRASGAALEAGLRMKPSPSPS